MDYQAQYVLLFLIFCFNAFFVASKGCDLVFQPNRCAAHAPRALLVNEQGKRIERIASNQFTACFYGYLEEHKDSDIVDLFSFSSKESEEINEIVLEANNHFTSLYIHGERATFNVIPLVNQWTHICVSWESNTGAAYLYIDGKEIPTDDRIQQGYSIGGDGYFILGQDQDSYNGGFQLENGVHGKLTQFNLWDRILSEDSVHKASRCMLAGNVVNWGNSTWMLESGAKKAPSDAPCGSTDERATCQNLEYSELKNVIMNDVLELQKQLKEMKEKTSAVEREMENLKSQTSLPVGFMYVQLPGLDPPNVLWPNMQWIDVSSNYAGLFFRVAGGEAAPFGQIQEGANPRLEEVQATMEDMRDQEQNPVKIPADGSWSKYFWDGTSEGGRNIFTRFHLTKSEVRPRNQAVKVWQRLK